MTNQKPNKVTDTDVKAKAASLIFNTPLSQDLTLSNVHASLVPKSDAVVRCKLVVEVDADTYNYIDEQALFNDRPDIRLGLDEGKFLSDAKITIEIALNPNLLEKIINQAKSENEVLQYLANLRDLEPENELLFTENWFVLSAIQQQKSKRIGYRTLWFHIHPEILTKEAVETGTFQSAIVESFASLAETSFLDSFQSAAIELERNSANYFSDIPLDAATPEINGDVISDLAAELTGFFKDSLQDFSESTDAVVQSSAKKNLEKDKRFSQSRIWQIQHNYFKQKQPATNQDDFYTNNSSFARYYAQIITNFLQDISPKGIPAKNANVIDISQPIYILELGSGSGCFAYRFLSHLHSLLELYSLKKLEIKYILTDFTAQYLDFWQQHPDFQPFFEQGLLDIAYFDLQDPEAIHLTNSGETLTIENLVNPLIVIANNVFNCLPQDAYYIEAGKLYNDLISLSMPEDSDINSWELLPQLSLSYKQQLVDDEHSGVPDVVRHYCQTLNRSHIIWPKTALSSLEHLRKLTNNRLMLLSSDVAYCHKVALQENGEPLLSVNGHASLPVNYHALATYCRQHQGQTLQPKRAAPGFSTQVLVFGHYSTDFQKTKAVYYEHQNSFPSQEIDILVEEQLKYLSLTQLIGYLQRHSWDAEIFLNCFPILLPQLETITAALRHDISQGMQQVWQGYYPINEGIDLAFYIAMILYSLGEYNLAIEYFEQSCRSHGDNPSTFYNLAMGYAHLDQRQKTIFYLEKTLELDPQFEAAQQFVKELT